MIEEAEIEFDPTPNPVSVARSNLAEFRKSRLEKFERLSSPPKVVEIRPMVESKITKVEEDPKVEKFVAGEMVFTPPMEDHACVFIEDTLLVVVSRNPRDQKSYESDVVRIELINSDDVDV